MEAAPHYLKQKVPALGGLPLEYEAHSRVRETKLGFAHQSDRPSGRTLPGLDTRCTSGGHVPCPPPSLPPLRCEKNSAQRYRSPGPHVARPGHPPCRAVGLIPVCLNRPHFTPKGQVPGIPSVLGTPGPLASQVSPFLLLGITWELKRHKAQPRASDAPGQESGPGTGTSKLLAHETHRLGVPADAHLHPMSCMGRPGCRRVCFPIRTSKGHPLIPAEKPLLGDAVLWESVRGWALLTKTRARKAWPRGAWTHGPWREPLSSCITGKRMREPAASVRTLSGRKHFLAVTPPQRDEQAGL